MPICAPISRHLFLAFTQQMVVGLGRMAAKEHVAVVVNGFDFNACLAQHVEL